MRGHGQLPMGQAIQDLGSGPTDLNGGQNGTAASSVSVRPLELHSSDGGKSEMTSGFTLPGDLDAWVSG